MPTGPAERPRRLRRLGLFVLGGLGLGSVFLSAALVGAGLHANLPLARRVAADGLSDLLSSELQGQFEFGSVDRISLNAVTASNVKVYDTYGNRVLEVSEIRAHASLLEVVGKILLGGDSISLFIRHARAEHVNTRLIPDPKTGEPTLARTFTPTPSTGTGGAGRRVRVWLPVVEIGRAVGRGKLAQDSPELRAGVVGAKGSILAGTEGATINVQRFGMALRGLGKHTAKGVGRLHIRAPEIVQGEFGGYYGNVQVNAGAEYKNDHLKLSADLPAVTPEAARELWSDWPLEHTVAAHLEAEGKLPLLETRLRAESSTGAALKAHGPLRLTDDFGLELQVSGQHLNLRAIWPEAPESDLEAVTFVALWRQDEHLMMELNGTSQPGKVGSEQIPAVDFRATLDPRGLVGVATLHERGLPTKIDFHLHPEGAVDLDVRARGFAMNHPRLRPFFNARGYAEARVQAHIEDKDLRAEIDASVSRFEMEDVKVARGTVSGSLQGPVDAPEKWRVDLDIRGQNLASGRYLRFDTVKARAQGPLQRPRVQASLSDRYGPSVQAEGRLRTRGKPQIDDLKFEVRRDRARISGKLAGIKIGPDRIEVKDLEVAGAGGTLKLSGEWSEERLLLQAKGQNVNLDQASRALGLPRGWFEGTLDIDADVTATKDYQGGHIKLKLEDGSIIALSNLDLDLDARLSRDKLTGTASAKVTGLGAVDAEWDTRLAGLATKPETWRDMTGRVQLALRDLELSNLAYVLPPEANIEEVRGTASARLRLERNVPMALPSLFVVGETEDLEVIVGSDEADAPPTHVKGINLQVGGAISGETGDSTGTTRLIDRRGVLTTASGTLKLDLVELVEHPEQLLKQLTTTPFEAALVVARRPLREMPEQLQLPGLDGQFEARASVTGNLKEPVISATAAIHELRGVSTGLAAPVSLRGTLMYEKESGEFAANVEAVQQTQRLAWGGVRGVAQWQHLVDGAPKDQPSWRGTGQLRFEGLPLELFQPLAEAELRGRLHGSIAMRRQKLIPDVAASLDLKQASVELVPIGDGRITLRSSGNLVKATTYFDDDQGFLKAEMLANVNWDGIVGSLDETRPLKITATADDFNAVVLTPLVRDIFPEVSGVLDANLAAQLVLEPAPADKTSDGKAPEKRWRGSFRGSARMKQGTLELAGLGLRLEDVQFQATSSNRDGLNVVQISPLSARAQSQERNVSASAELVFDNFELTSGSADVRLQSQAPLMLNGVKFADATGHAYLALKQDDDAMRVKVDIPTLTAVLPRASERDLIELEKNPGIHVLQPLGKPKRESGMDSTLPWIFDINFGEDVVVKRVDMSIPLSGGPTIVLGEETEVSGTIELEPRGRIEVVGKWFIIESGRVQFDDKDPGNPQLNVTATWRAPQGTTIIARVRGTLDEPELNWASDPPLPRGEADIYALLLGGTSGEGGGSAASAGATLLVNQIGDLIGKRTFNELQIRISEERSGAQAPTSRFGGSEQTYNSLSAAIKVTDEIWFEGSYKRQNSNGPVNTRNGVSGTLDWRFHRNWSLRTELGTIGTGVDLLWQHHY